LTSFTADMAEAHGNCGLLKIVAPEIAAAQLVIQKR
jgi:hypothetical protein